MRTLSATVLACGLALASPARADAPKGAWELVRTEDGITVQRRKVEGSNLHEFQGRGVVDAPLASVIAVLYDNEHRTEWMHRCVGSSRVAVVDERTAITYNRTAAPWPVAHRDVVLRARTEFDADAGVVRVDFESVTHPDMPPVEGVVRMPFLRGHWHLWSEDGGRATRVEYQVHANPGGQLPEWLANRVSKEIPLKTIQGLRAQVKRRDYRAFEQALARQPDYAALVAAVAAREKARAPAAPAPAPIAPPAPAAIEAKAGAPDAGARAN